MTFTKDALVINRQTCPVCNSTNRDVLISIKHNSPGFSDFIKYERYFGKAFQDAYNNGPINELLFEMVECKSCSFVYLTEVLNDIGMRLLYEEWLDKELLKEHYNNLEYNKIHETWLRIIKKHFNGKGKINVMDFGAGYGNFCSMAGKLGLNTYAFDLSEDKNDHLHDMGVTVINNFDQYEGYFDLIWVNQVVEHLADPAGILKQLQRCLSDKGLIFVAVPDCKDIKKIFKQEGLSHKLFRLLSPHQHINAFNNPSLRLLGTNNGLKPLSAIDFLSLYTPSFNLNELKLWGKKTIKNSMFSTGLFFKKQD